MAVQKQFDQRHQWSCACNRSRVCSERSGTCTYLAATAPTEWDNDREINTTCYSLNNFLGLQRLLKCRFSYIFTMTLSSCLPHFILVRIDGITKVVFNHNTLITDSKPDKRRSFWWYRRSITNTHAQTLAHLKNARHFRWGKLLAHTLLKCWVETCTRSAFPPRNSSSYQALTSDFCPAGTCTSLVSGWTPPYVSIRPCSHLMVERYQGRVQQNTR